MDFGSYISFWLNIPFKGDLVTSRAHSVFAIDYPALADNHDLLIFDMDDTLSAYKRPLIQESLELLKKLRAQGWSVGIYSNCSEKRTQELNQILQPLGIYNVQRSDKPHPDGFYEITSEYNIAPYRTVMIGDKLGTDMYGSYLAEFSQRILVEPYSATEGGKRADLWNRFIRTLEKLIYFGVFNRDEL